MHVFASCSSYTLGQMTSSREACALISAACGDLEATQLLPAVHALRELRRLAEVELRVDGGAQCIAKCRSRHFAAALKSAADVWFTIDDDVDTTRETLALLLAAVGDDAPRVCFAPYPMRNDPQVAAVEWTSVYLDREVVSLESAAKGHVRSALRGGFGLVAVNRAAMVKLVQSDVPRFLDDDGERKPAVFHEYIDSAGKWLGEDFAFFERARSAGVTIEALVTGETTHNGARLDLGVLR